MKYYGVFFIFAALMAICLGGEVRVVDGDTLVVDGARIRIWGIDAPESNQDGGAEATAALSEIIQEQEVSFSEVDQDRYKRTVAVIYVDGVDVGREMIARGFAWHYARYTHNDAGYAAAQKNAQADRAGIWSKKNPLPPWEWRRMR